MEISINRCENIGRVTRDKIADAGKNKTPALCRFLNGPARNGVAIGRPTTPRRFRVLHDPIVNAMRQHRIELLGYGNRCGYERGAHHR